MRIAVAADELTGIAEAIPDELHRRGHETIEHGAYSDGERDDWAWASEAAARDVARGDADQAIVACWTGTGASIAADAQTAAGARRWNDANVLALSLRSTSLAELGEILDAWFEGQPSAERSDLGNIAHLEEIERD
jgi:ribose 5-phosphate isomerase B